MCRNDTRRVAARPSLLLASLLGLVTAALFSACAQGAPDQFGNEQVVVRPGDNLADLASKMPERTAFLLEPGIYRMQSIVPKNGQKFIGKDGTRLVGAIVLGNWRRGEDGLWMATDLPPPLHHSGSCERGRGDLCKYREDIFVDGKVYERVDALEKLGPGKWAYNEGIAYLKIDPTGKTIEMSAAPAAFGGKAFGVTLANLVVEKYASEAQHGAIDGRETTNWKLMNVSAMWNHGGGIDLGENMHVQGGRFSHNGQIGMLGERDGSLVEGVEIAYNNYARFSVGWEAGGTKFSATKNLIVRNSCVHNNFGPGLWTDIDNVNTLYENNKVFDNAGDGIKHEISYKAVIRNNISARNGYGHDIWGWGSQILIQNSADVEAYDNVVEVAPNHGNGIAMIYQERGSGRIGEFLTTRNSVTNNVIIYLGMRGRSGRFPDFRHEQFNTDQSNIFDRNEYIVPDPAHEYWETHSMELRWPIDRKYRMEEHGKLKIEKRAPMELSCKQ